MNLNILYGTDLAQISSLIIGSTTLVICIYMWATRAKYELVAEISKLNLYPVKGLPGIEVPSVEITPIGLKHGIFRDRMWVIKGPNGRHLSPIEEPSLLLIKPQIKDNQVWLDADGMKTLKLDIISDSDKVEEIRIFKTSTKGFDCGDEVAGWFNKYLKREDVRILQFMDNFKRPATDPFKRANKPEIVFQSGSGVSLLSEASVADLNSRINIRVYFKNFRPNVVVKGNQPYEEDTWKRLKMGEDAELVRLKPCERCTMTTVDPYTGKKDPGGEPLKTLRTYRLVQNPQLRKLLRDIPIFATECAVVHPGVLSVGDPVSAQKDSFVY